MQSLLCSAYDWGIAHMAPRLGHIVSCETSPISVSTILRAALWLGSSRKLTAICYNRNRHCRAQPSGWLYTSTTQRPTYSWALKIVDLSQTTWWRWYSCRVLIRRVETSQREPLACSRTESTFIVPIICHTQRGWVVLGWYPCVISRHRRLRHFRKVGITHLSRARYIPKLSFLDHQLC